MKYEENILGLKKTVATTLDVVSLDQVRDFLRVDPDVCDNGLLTLIRDAATRAIEEYLNSPIMLATYQVTYYAENRRFRLPGANIAAVSSVKYKDTDNALQTIASSNYTLISPSSMNSYVYMDDAYSFPSLGDDDDKIQITYTAGYSSVSSVPPVIPLCILNLCADYYDDRSLLTGKVITGKLRFALDPYRVPFLA